MLEDGSKLKEQRKQNTLRSASKWESTSQFAKQQCDEAIKLLVALYDSKPSVCPRFSDLVAQDAGEGSSTGPREFINFCSNTCPQDELRIKNVNFFHKSQREITHFIFHIKPEN